MDGDHPVHGAAQPLDDRHVGPFGDPSGQGHYALAYGGVDAARDGSEGFAEHVLVDFVADGFVAAQEGAKQVAPADHAGPGSLWRLRTRTATLWPRSPGRQSRMVPERDGPPLWRRVVGV